MTSNSYRVPDRVRESGPIAQPSPTQPNRELTVVCWLSLVTKSIHRQGRNARARNAWMAADAAVSELDRSGLGSRMGAVR